MSKLDNPKIIVNRTDHTVTCTFGAGFKGSFIGKTSCTLTNTGNGYIAKFPSHVPSEQDYYVCLSYPQASDLFMALKKFAKELK